jgi:hypothetical protein
MKTIGISQKVWLPGAVGIVTGIALILVGLDVEGKTAIAAGISAFGIGYGAKAAPVERKS